MRAAIYARKSPIDRRKQVAEDAKSVTLQVQLSRAFAARNDFEVAEDHIYVDDNVFTNRNRLNVLLAAAKTTPRPFDVLVTMNQDRLGREIDGTASVLKALIESGVTKPAKKYSRRTAVEKM